MKKGIIITLGLLVLLVAGYFGGVGYYSERFVPNTSFASINIANLTLDEAQEKVRQTINEETVTLIEKGEEIGKVSLSALEYNVDIDDTLTAMYQAQNPNRWPLNLFETTNVQRVLAEQSTINTNQFEEVLSTLSIKNEERTPPVDAKVAYDSQQGYYIESGSQGTQIDMKRLSQAIMTSIEEGTNTVAVEDYYQQPEITEDSQVITETLANINRVLETKITLEIADEKITIPKELIEKWVHFDANNQLTVDETLVYNYLTELNDQYSTEGKDRQFESTLQGTVTVPAGILGWSIDIEQETQNIVADLQKAEDVTRPAAFTGIGTRLGRADDIGSTYVEVDLSHQMMYLYVNGEVIVATNIVSGNPSSPTAPGANAIIEMLRDTNLVGTDLANIPYSAPVQYWMRFDYQAQGIHDANWQYAFGGDTYVYSGSLGCINTPLDQVALIYEYVEYGTPVLVFY